MKTLFFLFLSIISVGILHSQEINCVEKQKQLSSSITDNDFIKANETFSELKLKCEAKSEVFYLSGITVLQYNVELAADDKKEIAVRDLVKFYNQYDKSFPENKNGNAINIAMLLYETKISKDDEAYLNFEKAFNTDKFQFKNPNALYIYFNLFKEKYNDKNNKITFDQFIEKYSNILSVIEKNKVEFPEKKVEFDNAFLAVTSLVRNDFTKENTIAYAENKFSTNKENASWLTSTAELLSQKAPSSVIFGTIANQLHQLNPTSKSAYHLANFNLKTKNQNKAIEYFMQSASLSMDKVEKAKTYFTIATILASSDKSKSREMLLLALQNNPSGGEYYIFLSNLYSNSVNECGTNPLEKKAIYQLAKLTAVKASQVEPRYLTTANRIAQKYQNETPTTQELNQIKKNNNKILVGCWINETVQF